jgi:hypothetical protein
MQPLKKEIPMSIADRFLLSPVFSCFSISTLALTFSAQAAPICDANVKEAAARRINSLSNLSAAEQLKAEAQLYETYKNCAADGANVPSTDTMHVAARQCEAKVVYLGSTYFEEMPCCGYDPQRRSFACPVRIKQGGGFGPAPLPGSREYVFHCVQNALNVFQPVAVDSVHLANSALPPSWQFAVIAAANQNLPLVQPMSGQQRIARSILSWGLQPTSCNYLPIWGNVIDYKIRLDQ